MTLPDLSICSACSWGTEQFNKNTNKKDKVAKMAKILKLQNNGGDFGYVELEGEVFYGGATRAQATQFDLKKYKDSDAYYFRVAGTKETYMDVKVSTSRVQTVKPALDVEHSSICAWELHGSELRMIIGNTWTGKCLSRSTDDARSNALYGNLAGAHCSVIIEDA